jgi:iron only hydrogenase large subunit-like protein
LEITPVRGLEGVKEVTLKIEGTVEEWRFLEGVELKCAITNGLENAHQLMEAIKNGDKFYHFIEIMACPGGCLGGGGQPFPVDDEIRLQRMNAIYEEDRNLPFRKSHENPEIIQVYKDFLEEPLSPKSHKLLHTSYLKREQY